MGPVFYHKAIHDSEMINDWPVQSSNDKLLAFTNLWTTWEGRTALTSFMAEHDDLFESHVGSEISRVQLLLYIPAQERTRDVRINIVLQP